MAIKTSGHSAMSGWRIRDLGIVSVGSDVTRAINNHGVTAGAIFDACSRSVRAFVAREGSLKLLGTLGGSFSVGCDVNNLGHVVGGSLTERDASFHAFLWKDGTLVDLNRVLSPAEVDGWELLQAFGINDKGQIVGVGHFQGEDHIFLLTPAEKWKGSG